MQLLSRSLQILNTDFGLVIEEQFQAALPQLATEVSGVPNKRIAPSEKLSGPGPGRLDHLLLMYPG
jgi:hypothetical protein